MKEKNFFIISVYLMILWFCFAESASAQQGAVKTLVIDTAKFRNTVVGQRSAAYKDLVAKQFLDLNNVAYIGDPSGRSVLRHVTVNGDIALDYDAYSLGSFVINNGGAYTVNLGDASQGDSVFSTLTAVKLSMDDPGPGAFPGAIKDQGDFVYKSDIAEGISVIAGEPCDVVVISKDKDLSVTRSKVKFDSRVAGVISEDPKIYMGAAEDKMPLALSGIVRCNVNTENGPIKRGDILVTSSEPGYAMKAEENQILPGMVVGSALDSLEQGKGKINILIN